jgi:hypothetical protein
MVSKRFIHSASDIVLTLEQFVKSGFQVIEDSPQDNPQPHFLSEDELSHVQKGSFCIIRPDWVFGPFQTMEITDGHNRGKFFLCPRVNYTCVSISFQGERVDHGRRRFGDCVVSCHRDWLKLPKKELLQTPAEVVEWYNKICRRLSSGTVIKAGGHKYHVTRSVLADPTALECLPPFDFIPWNDMVLHNRKPE